MEGNIHFYCINLKHRTDRWQSFYAQPAVQEIKQKYVFERFDAVPGSTVDIQHDDRISLRTRRNVKESMRRDHEDLSTAGAIGCYLSHIEIWKRVVNNSEPYTIVFEDDAKLAPTFLQDLQEAMKEINLLPKVPDVWSFKAPWSFYYETKGKKMPEDIPNNIRGDWIMNTTPGGTAGYLITKEGAKKLLENAFPIEMQIDLYICMNVELGRIFCVMNRKIVLGVLSEHITSDIQLPSGCPICDVPTKFDQRGFLLLNIPITLVGLIAITGLIYLRALSRP